MDNLKGYTTMEVVLTSVLLTTLALGLVIGFTEYIDLANEVGVLRDLRGIFSNSIRVMVLEKGRTPSMEEMKELLITDGFSLSDVCQEADNMFDVCHGVKRYTVKLGIEEVIVRANHSRKLTSMLYVINTAGNDIISVLGTTTECSEMLFIAD